MIRQKVTITNPTGLHLRPAGMDAMVSAIEDGLGE